MKTIAKAVLGGLISLGGALGTAAADGHISLSEGIIAATAGLVAFGAVYGVTNKPAA